MSWFVFCSRSRLVSRKGVETSQKTLASCGCAATRDSTRVVGSLTQDVAHLRQAPAALYCPSAECRITAPALLSFGCRFVLLALWRCTPRVWEVFGSAPSWLALVFDQLGVVCPLTFLLWSGLLQGQCWGLQGSPLACCGQWLHGPHQGQATEPHPPSLPPGSAAGSELSPLPCPPHASDAEVPT